MTDDVTYRAAQATATQIRVTAQELLDDHREITTALQRNLTEVTDLINRLYRSSFRFLPYGNENQIFEAVDSFEQHLTELLLTLLWESLDPQAYPILLSTSRALVETIPQPCSPYQSFNDNMSAEIADLTGRLLLPFTQPTEWVAWVCQLARLRVSVEQCKEETETYQVFYTVWQALPLDLLPSFLKEAVVTVAHRRFGA